MEATMDISDTFNLAVQLVRCLPKKGAYQPSYSDAGKVYSYFKQATLGTCTEAKPWSWEIIKRAKWEAWTSLENMPKETAMSRYIDEIKKMLLKMQEAEDFVTELESNMETIAPKFAAFCDAVEISLHPSLRDWLQKEITDELARGQSSGFLVADGIRPTEGIVSADNYTDRAALTNDSIDMGTSSLLSSIESTIQADLSHTHSRLLESTYLIEQAPQGIDNLPATSPSSTRSFENTAVSTSMRSLDNTTVVSNDSDRRSFDDSADDEVGEGGDTCDDDDDKEGDTQEGDEASNRIAKQLRLVVSEMSDESLKEALATASSHGGYEGANEEEEKTPESSEDELFCDSMAPEEIESPHINETIEPSQAEPTSSTHFETIKMAACIPNSDCSDVISATQSLETSDLTQITSNESMLMVNTPRRITTSNIQASLVHSTPQCAQGNSGDEPATSHPNRSSVKFCTTVMETRLAGDTSPMLETRAIDDLSPPPLNSSDEYVKVEMGGGDADGGGGGKAINNYSMVVNASTRSKNNSTSSSEAYDQSSAKKKVFKDESVKQDRKRGHLKSSSHRNLDGKRLNKPTMKQELDDRVDSSSSCVSIDDCEMRNAHTQRISATLVRMEDDLHEVIDRLDSIETRVQKSATPWWVSYLPTSSSVLWSLWPVLVNIVFYFWYRMLRRRLRKIRK